MVLSKRAGESIPNIVGSLSGSAWRLLEDFDVAKAEKEGTFGEILATLDKHFQYDSRVQLPGDFENYFNLNRRHGQTLLSYVTDHDEMLKKLNNHGIELPAPVQGWHLLKRAGITREQRQLVTLRAPDLTKTKVVEALYLILGQDHKSAHQPHDRRPFHRGKGRGYMVADDDTGYYHDDAEEIYGQSWEDAGYFEGDDEYYGNDEHYYDDGPDDYGFDQDAVYYQSGDAETEASTDPPWSVEEYDEAYAAYLDARKRFSDLRLSRGFLPVVAINDPAAGNLSPGILSPGASPQRGGGKSPKGKSKGKGKSKTTFRYNKPPAKQADPKGRAKAMTCLRCGQPGHFAAQCPTRGSPSSSSPHGTKRSAPIESAVLTEGAHVTFVDAGGHERPDVTMLDPGASAFLSGFGPFLRYLEFLKAHQFPIDDIEFSKCCRKFHFGGDGASWSHWVARLPMCVGGVVGQVFLVKGETPLLCDRPIMEALGISLDFAGKSIRFSNGPWQPATIGAHGEYLLPLWEPEEPLDFSNLDFQFDHQVAGDGEVDPKPMSLAQFEEEEQVMNVNEASSEETPAAGDLPLPRHQLKTLDQRLVELHNDYRGYVTAELHSKPKRVIWQVYCGRARTSEIAESLGASVETFSFETGWNFNLQDHRSAFLRRLEAEVPDELFLAPTCAPWSPMQNLAARDPEQKQRLLELREWHHGTHLTFVRRVYETQIRNGGHAHLEQPAFALSWKTQSLSPLPGMHARFDQCQYFGIILDLCTYNQVIELISEVKKVCFQ